MKKTRLEYKSFIMKRIFNIWYLIIYNKFIIFWSKIYYKSM